MDENSLSQPAYTRTAMSAVVSASIAGPATAAAEYLPAPFTATQVRQPPRRRRTLIRRSLVVADAAGLSAAFLASVLIFGLSAEGAGARPMYEFAVFFLSLPAWVLLAAMHGLYRYDDERLGYSTVDDFVGVIHLVTLGAWIFFLGCWLTGISYPRPGKLIVFWILATLLVSGCRVLARSICLRSPAYIQNVVVIGAGEVGQLVARKIGQHREYGLRLLGLVDEEPLRLRADLGDVAILGTLDELPQLVREREVERVIVAFSSESDAAHGEGLANPPRPRRPGRRRPAPVRAARAACRRAHARGVAAGRASLAAPQHRRADSEAPDRHRRRLTRLGAALAGVCPHRLADPPGFPRPGLLSPDPARA